VGQDRAGEFGEEALDEVEPGAVLGREGELEAAGRSRGEPSPSFFGDVRGWPETDQRQMRDCEDIQNTSSSSASSPGQMCPPARTRYLQFIVMAPPPIA
jgi:hypothetical protein